MKEVRSVKSALDVLTKTANVGYIKVLDANLTSDTFTVAREDHAAENGLAFRCNTLSEYFTSFADQGFVHEDDVTDFRANTSIDYLRSFFRENHGKNLHWICYRRKTSSGYRWAVLEIQSAEDYSDDNAAVYIVVKDIQESMASQPASMSGVLRALCGRYDSIYALDVKRHTLIPFRTNNHGNLAFDAFIQSSPDYEDLLERYINSSVYEEDRAHVRRITDIHFVLEYLSRRDSLSGEFRTVYQGVIFWYRIVFARIESTDGLRQIALGLMDVTDEKRMESGFRQDNRLVLIVNPNQDEQEQLSAMLAPEYQSRVVSTGEDAMEILHTEHESVAVILVDSFLPDMRLLTFLNRVRSEHLFRSIPIVVTDDVRESAEKYIQRGAADILLRPFVAGIVKSRIGLMIRYQESANMLSILERDPLTGLYSKEYFFRIAEKIMNDEPQVQYAVLLSDVEHYHFYKERYGQAAANDVLRNMAAFGPKILHGYAAGGRIGEDVFAYLIRYSTDIRDDVRMMQHCFAGISMEANLSVKYGLYVVDEDIPVSAMCDRAVIAVKSISDIYGKDLAEFDQELRSQMLQTQQILENAEEGLNQDQFVVYYQPKHHISSLEIDGAEAVVRWIHPIMGFMSPVSFIPLFEKNGFITSLDQFILNSVCKDLTEWVRRGEPVVPISVNVSRVDLAKSGLANRVIKTVDSYGLDHKLIHLEITESGYSADPDTVIQEVQKLHDAGFRIELDDFGAGYSSLSALSALPVDVLKLDMSLLSHNEEASSRNILEFSMKLAKILNMETVQEGVETKEQMEHITSLGCDHVQGFLFSRPLPKAQFIAYCREHQSLAAM